YADDIHFKGGALLMENLGWASTMFSYSSRPPDPLLSTERWRAMWLQRLENTPLLVDNWLQHQHRDAFWKHGSICEDYDDIEAAVLAVGGWYDAYSNAIPRVMENLQCPRKAIIGPWAHKYPHFAVPEPRIGFLQEALRWWDRWLKDKDTDVENDPLYRVYVMDSTRPSTSQAVSDGHWISMEKWPDNTTDTTQFFFNDTKLVDSQQSNQSWLVDSPQDTGTACGEFCIMWLGADWPDDQRVDDANSLAFDSGVLENETTIVGAPIVELEISSATPQANVAVRLSDVWPDGASTRVSFGVLNLCHRNNHEHPEPLIPGERYRVRVQLDDIAYRIAAGHKLRLSVSNAYWPMIWSSPEKGTLTLQSEGSKLQLPTQTSQNHSNVSFPPEESAAPLRQETLRESSNQRTVTHDLVSNVTTVSIVDDFGKHKNLEHGLVNSEIARETYTINADDPLSCRASTHWSEAFERDQWHVRTETKTEMWSDKNNFYMKAHIEAFEDTERVFDQKWERKVARNLV
ncbi:MAG: CocE/NonD family hydrolase, partial [Gammaproteobacteria bacterium]|nr:CocE/NonD family hydrolase [Gammaproteobacteria bacterium]